MLAEEGKCLVSPCLLSRLVNCMTDDLVAGGDVLLTRTVRGRFGFSGALFDKRIQSRRTGMSWRVCVAASLALFIQMLFPTASVKAWRHRTPPPPPGCLVCRVSPGHRVDTCTCTSSIPHHGISLSRHIFAPPFTLSHTRTHTQYFPPDCLQPVALTFFWVTS